MNILCVDDEPFALEMITELCNKLDGNNSVNSFDDSSDALSFAKAHHIDVAFLDIDMPGLNGIELSKALREINPFTNIIMTTAYSEFTLDAFANDCSGYLLKPISFDKLTHQMQVLRFPISDTTNTKRVRIQCFGNFEIFIDDKPIHFKYQLSKELLAILIDRKGALCSSSHISNILWGDENHSEYYKKIRRELISTLTDYGCDDILTVVHGQLGIIVDKVDCDYYNYISNNNISNYSGEFMNQYSWAILKNTN